MKRLFALILVLMMGVSACAEPSEAAIVEQAIGQLKATWLQDIYSKVPNPDADGYLEILNTQVTYIRPEVASQREGDSSEGECFHDIRCVVDFVLLSDFYGTEPYLMDAGIYGSVAIYRDGSSAVLANSPFSKYYSRTFKNDFSGIIESVHNCGSEYNAVFHLLEK